MKMKNRSVFNRMNREAPRSPALAGLRGIQTKAHKRVPAVLLQEKTPVGLIWNQKIDPRQRPVNGAISGL